MIAADGRDSFDEQFSLVYEELRLADRQCRKSSRRPLICPRKSNPPQWLLCATAMPRWWPKWVSH
jgi:hypothetical protein